MPYVLVDLPASLAHHHAPCLTRLGSFSVGRNILACDVCAAPLRQHVGQTPRRRHLPLPTLAACSLTTGQKGQTVPMVYWRRVTMSAFANDADVVPEGTQTCVAQAVGLTIRRK
jgi:hypothetical protein